jgi:predicted Fe-Mo cluster-binding NifX family protein
MLLVVVTVIKKVAIPIFNENVAPCFESASLFMICDVDSDGGINSHMVDCVGCEGFGRIRLLLEHDVKVLLCNGIKGFYLDILESSGLSVINNLSIGAEKALQMYLDGKTKPQDHNNNLDEISCEIPHEDLLCWARELFESHGYTVSIIQDEEDTPFPVDLVAEINCPICHRQIRVAVCCGAHTYRPDQEIREFHHVSSSMYQAKVYVYPGNPLIQKRCREYNIQLIDPDSESANRDQKTTDRIPLLEYPVVSHEKAFTGKNAKRE